MYRHPLVQGKIGELSVAIKFGMYGFNVYAPYVDIDGCDLLIEYDGIFRRVQVKSSAYIRDEYGQSIIFNLTKLDRHHLQKGAYSNNHVKYTKEEVDYFGLYDVLDDCVYLIKNTENCVKSITIRKGPTENGQKSGLNLAKNFIFENAIHNVITEIEDEYNKKYPELDESNNDEELIDVDYLELE